LIVEIVTDCEPVDAFEETDATIEELACSLERRVPRLLLALPEVIDQPEGSDQLKLVPVELSFPTFVTWPDRFTPVSPCVTDEGAVSNAIERQGPPAQLMNVPVTVAEDGDADELRAAIVIVRESDEAEVRPVPTAVKLDELFAATETV
jgi:hypothetical protein